MNLEFPGAANFALHSVVQRCERAVQRGGAICGSSIALNGTFQITGSPDNNGTYTVTGVAFSPRVGASRR